MSDLRSFLTLLKEKYANDVVVIQEPVDPDFEITAINELRKDQSRRPLFR
jgi:3-polyprenyl-4-hydroxybenzoate decarboxylase